VHNTARRNTQSVGIRTSVGCIIGSGGTKIEEIRKISGAMIHISKREGGITDRTIKITEKPEAVALAQCVINMSVELKKVTLEIQNPATAGGPGTSNPVPSSSGSSSADASCLPNIIRFAQLMAKPGALNALTSLSALETLTELLEGTGASAPVQTTDVHRSHKTDTARLRSPGGGMGPQNKKCDRTKSAPY
jgi:poly(rC)-binding protein 2/3/4